MKRITAVALTLILVLCAAFPAAALAASAESSSSGKVQYGPDTTISVSTSRPQDGVTQIDDGLMTYRFNISDGSHDVSFTVSFTGYITGSYDGPPVLDPGKTPLFRASIEPGGTMVLKQDGEASDDYVFGIYSDVFPLNHSPSYPAGDVFTFTEKGAYNVYLDTKQGDEICTFQISVFSRPSQESFPENPSALTSFSDVPSGAWYEREVAEAEKQGIISGTGTTFTGKKLFRPDSTLSVAEAYTLAAKTRAQYEGDTIPPGLEGYSWSLIYRDYASMRGILKQGDFPYDDRPVTREEMAYIFSRTMPKEEYEFVYNEKLSGAPDSGDSPYKAEIDLLYHCHIVSGSDSKGSFRPESTITRAEAAAIINRVSKLTGFQESQKN